MSRTKPRTTGGSNPIRKYVNFSGTEGVFKYWDKDKKENVVLESIEVTVLDVRNSISGYCEAESCGITSNLVGNTSKEDLTVSLIQEGKLKQIAKGLYKDIKNEVVKYGGKFTNNILCLADLGEGEEVINIQLSGVGLTSWIEFTSKNTDFYDMKITLGQGTLSKREKGNTVAVTKEEEKELDAKLKKNPRAPRPVWFYTVGFETVDLTDEEIDKATEEDKKLQAYFEAGASEDEEVKEEPKKSRNKTAPVVEDDEDEDDGDKSNLPF